MVVFKAATIERFRGKYVIDQETECWNWTAALLKKTYGIFKANRKTRLAHHFSYELHIGKIPDGEELHHTCLNKKCVNPFHLKPVTRLQHRRYEHHGGYCKRGHKLNRENMFRNGFRNGRVRYACRLCRSIRRRQAK